MVVTGEIYGIRKKVLRKKVLQAPLVIIMVFVTYTETYDLSTKKDQVGFVGIHTPGISALVNLYQGLFQNHKYYRIHSCDVTMACASMLPADPLQVGVEAGSIAPQDMFNPILYKACSNDSFDIVANRLYTTGGTVGNGTDSIKKLDDPYSGVTGFDDFQFYYGLLADNSWRKAMPQAGLSIRGLYPMVYQLVSSFGNAGPMPTGQTPGLNGIQGINASGAVAAQTTLGRTFRGPAMRIPRLPTHQGPASSAVSGESGFMPTPITYVAMLVTPPAKLNILYYRMRITWTIEFSDVCTMAEAQQTTGMYQNNQSVYTYASDYDSSSKVMDNKESVVDSYGTTLDHVMTTGA